MKGYRKRRRNGKTLLGKTRSMKPNVREGEEQIWSCLAAQVEHGASTHIVRLKATPKEMPKGGGIGGIHGNELYDINVGYVHAGLLRLGQPPQSSKKKSMCRYKHVCAFLCTHSRQTSHYTTFAEFIYMEKTTYASALHVRGWFSYGTRRGMALRNQNHWMQSKVPNEEEI